MVFGFNKVPTVEASEVEDLVSNGHILIDVREEDEWEAGHHREATHISMGTIEENLSKFTIGNDYIIVCRSGARSSRVSNYLLSKDFNVSNLDGGMKALFNVSNNIINSKGSPGQII